jgi:hypothetical protein
MLFSEHEFVTHSSKFSRSGRVVPVYLQIAGQDLLSSHVVGYFRE